MGIEKQIIRKEDKLYIQGVKSKQEPVLKEIVLLSKDYDKEPESVRVKIGLTVIPKQFESIRIDYACTVHHEPGVAKRDEAFDVAKFHCMERLVDDISDLHSKGILKDHWLASGKEDLGV